MDSERETDLNDWRGQLLTRLYIGTGQFDKAFGVCVLRLRKHPQEYHTLEIARQMADLFKDVANGRKLMNDFLENLKGQIPSPQYDRFRGALVSSMNASVSRWRSMSSNENWPDGPINRVGGVCEVCACGVRRV